MASSVEERSTSSSDAYKSRYYDYEKVYMDTFPEPPEPPEVGDGTTGEGAAAKSALTRQQRYNDKKTTSTVKPNGGRNARDSQS